MLDLLLDLDFNHLPLPLGCLTVLLPWHVVSYSPDEPFCFDLQYVLKWFLFPHLWHFLPHTGHSLNGWEMYCIYCMSYLGSTLKNWLCGHCLSCVWTNWFHLQSLLWQFHHWICVSWSLSPSFHAPWHAGGGLETWHPLSSSLIWPTSWLQSVSLPEKATLSYVPFSLLWSGTGISQLYLWYVGQAGHLTQVLLMWFQ